MAGRPSKLLPFPSRLVQDPGAQGLVSPNLERAGATTRVDPQAAAAPALGMAKVGAGLQDLGTATGQLAHKVEEAQTVTAEYKSAEEMEKAKFDINAAIQQEQDQSKWPGIIDARLGQLSSTVQGLPNVPDSARPALDHKLAMFGIDVRGGAQDHAVRKSIGDAIDSGNAVVKRAGATGDLALGESTIDGMVQKHYITPEVGDAKKLDLRSAVKQTDQNKQKDSFLMAVQADPEEAMKVARDPKFNVDPEMRAWAQHTAAAGIRTQTATTIDELNSHIASGEFVTTKQVDAYKEGNPKITDEMAANAKKQVVAANNAAHQQWKTENSDTNISRAMGAIRGYDPKSDPDLKQYDALNSWVHRNLVPGDLEAASTALKTRLAGRAATEEKDPRMKDVSAKLDYMQGRGEFGSFKTPRVQTITQKDTEGNEVTLHKQVTDINLKAQAAAEDARVKVESQLRTFMKANPNANQSQILTELNRLKPGSLKAAAMDSLDGVSSDVPPMTGPLSLAAPNAGPLQAPLGPVAPTQRPVLLPEDPGRIPKAQVIGEEKPVASSPEMAAPVAETTGPTDIHAAKGTVPAAKLQASLPEKLKPHARDYVDAAEENGLDPRFLAAISMFETGNGTAPAFRNKNNAMGISNKHGPTHQESVRASIFKMARALANPNGPYKKARTVDEIAAIYSPPGAENDPNDTNAEWPDSVKRNLRKLKKS